MLIFRNLPSIILSTHISVTLLVVTHLQAAAPSPQDKYLQLYLRLQEAEKLEREEQKASAHKLYTEVLRLLQALKEAYPTWEEGIVNYRIRYCQDKINLLQNAKDRFATTTPPTTTEIIIESPSPTKNKIKTEPPPPPTKPAPPSPSKIQDLEDELNFTKQRLAQAQNEINILRTRLQATEKQLVMSRSSDLDERLASILQENSQLRNQLNETERQLRSLAQSNNNSNNAHSRATATTIANLQSQLRKVQEKLALAEQENNAFRHTTAELKSQLESAQNNLIAAQKANLSQRDNESFQRENEVLRDIITRQIQEQARRDAAKKLATEEIENLKIQSSVLRQQLDILASPIINLTSEQLSLLRLPSQITISGERSNTPEAAPNKNASRPPPQESPTSIDPAIEYRAKARIPEDVRGLAQQASDAFSQSQYDEAIALYQQIIQKYPESLYAWSNLGVVHFQKQDYTSAETALKEAIRLNPADTFSYSMLGIVYYQKGEYDLAIEQLTRATALEPNDPRTRNYLGIACSQKGWQEAAEKECRRAIELDPNYGDAHFNLAVIYATQRPPAKELARRHYKTALDLGIPKDEKLEKLIQ